MAWLSICHQMQQQKNTNLCYIWFIQENSDCSLSTRHAREHDGVDHGCQMAIADLKIFKWLALRASGLWLRYATLAKFDPFLSLECGPTPSTLAQSKERKGSNFAIWQPWCRLENCCKWNSRTWSEITPFATHSMTFPTPCLVATKRENPSNIHVV